MINALFENELERIGDQERRRALQQFLIPPFIRPASWPFGPAGRTIAAWVVAADDASGTQIVYSEEGFQQDRWGIASSRSAWAGTDDSWFLSLDDAFIHSGLWRGPLPDDYEVA